MTFSRTRIAVSASLPSPSRSHTICLVFKVFPALVLLCYFRIPHHPPHPPPPLSASQIARTITSAIAFSVFSRPLQSVVDTACAHIYTVHLYPSLPISKLILSTASGPPLSLARSGEFAAGAWLYAAPARLLGGAYRAGTAVVPNTPEEAKTHDPGPTGQTKPSFALRNTSAMEGKSLCIIRRAA